MKINIEADIPDRWVDHFCSMLKLMEHNGNIGRSEYISIYSDGDGDFCPTFNFDVEYNKVKPKDRDPEFLITRIKEFDAG